eukprot:874841-Pyramimonas_sp.AAC.1
MAEETSASRHSGRRGPSDAESMAAAPPWLGRCPRRAGTSGGATAGGTAACAQPSRRASSR